jgi:single-strand DNA-binding protein
MNSLRNRVYLIGNLGADPEVKQLESGKTVAKMNLATSESYKDSDGKKVTDTQWHNLIVWGPSAKTAGKYLKKGAEIAVEGKLVHRKYDDKNGAKHYVTEVVVSEFLMIGSKNSNNN